MSVTLHTLSGETLTATQHAIENVAALGNENGILYGLAVTASENTITIGNGFGMICGRLFEIQSEEIAVVLPSSQKTGQIIITLDLSLETPLTVSYDLTGAALTQTANAVFTDGIYQIQLCTFTATSSAVSDPVITAPMLKGIGAPQAGDYITKSRTVNGNLKALDNAIKSHYTGPGITDDFTPVVAGMITNSKKTIEFTINLVNPLEGVSAVSAYGCYLRVMQTGPGYLWGNASARKAVDPNEITCYRTKGGLRIKWTHSTAINNNAINNGAVIVDCQIKFRLT